jgi:hypothetical protein
VIFAVCFAGAAAFHFAMDAGERAVCFKLGCLFLGLAAGISAASILV